MLILKNNYKGRNVVWMASPDVYAEFADAVRFGFPLAGIICNTAIAPKSFAFVIVRGKMTENALGYLQRRVDNASRGILHELNHG